MYFELKLSKRLGNILIVKDVGLNLYTEHVTPYAIFLKYYLDHNYIM